MRRCILRSRREPDTTAPSPELTRAILSHEARSGFEMHAREIIKRAWKTGQLPYRRGLGWICGYRVRKSFFNASVTEVLVGPGKPQRDKHWYSSVTVDWSANDAPSIDAGHDVIRIRIPRS